MICYHLHRSRPEKILNVFQRIHLRFFRACGLPPDCTSFASSRTTMSDRLLLVKPRWVPAPPVTFAPASPNHLRQQEIQNVPVFLPTSGWTCSPSNIAKTSIGKWGNRSGTSGDFHSSVVSLPARTENSEWPHFLVSLAINNKSIVMPDPISGIDRVPTVLWGTRCARGGGERPAGVSVSP